MKRPIALLSSLIALAPLPASALSFGEMTLRSRMGEALLAEIPLHPADGETPLRKCFALAASQINDLPTPNDIRLTLIQSEQGYRLRLQGRHTINEPALAIRLRYRCDGAQEKELVLVPEPPANLSVPTAASASIASEEELELPTTPRSRAPKATDPETNSKTARPRSAIKRKQQTDHLRLGSGDELDLQSYPSLKIDWAILEESEARLTRLEQQLGHLRQEIASIDHEINQVRQQAAGKAADLPAPPQAQPPAGKNQRNWLEFLAAMLLCAGVSAWVAHRYEARRRQR